MSNPNMEIAQNGDAEADKKPKTPAQLKKDAAKAEKLKKFQEKQVKMQEQKANAKPKEDKPVKEKKVKEIVVYEADTKPGEKKDTSNEIPASYSPKYVEAAWYSWWEKEGFFKPEYGGRSETENPKGKFVMVIPPPNVTGTLHLGHALTNSVEDTIARWHRMKGRTVLWNPGCDHAGIATQVVVEKKLWREKKLTRHDLGREAFVDEVWKWKNEKGHYIYGQLKAMGSSVDWDRACFTMDEKMCVAVREAFIRLHNTGRIYRANRLVNWSCSLRSAISDIEVEKKELDGPTMLNVPAHDKPVQFGMLIEFAYPIDGSDEEIVVATTRIETMLGDVAIAVHPKDERFKHLIGKTCQHPFVDRKLVIVADEIVDTEFGTGAVKITPAHDHNDYGVGMRHKLPFIVIIGDDGLMTHHCAQFEGMKRFVAREEVLKALKDKGLYRETKPNAMVVPICSRSKDVIEPIPKAQWYVNCGDMAKNALDVVEKGELKIIPEMHIKTWNSWMNNIRDWCISRQLWWGHRIPAYFITLEGGEKGDSNKLEKFSADNKYWVSALSPEEAKTKAANKFNVDESKVNVEQDPDVLDTWFSAAIFPFSIFGWPNKTPDLEKFYPGTLLETGHDIIFFWVARMVFFGVELTGKLPFEKVYLHAMVRDAHGRKMSKSLGNVLDPLDVIHGITLDELQKQLDNSNLDPKEIGRAKAGQKSDYPDGIPECGTDALRFALCAYTQQGTAINLDVLRVQGYRHFCNKLWNAVKFTMRQLGDDFKPSEDFKVSQVTNAMNQWILSRLSFAINECNSGFEAFDLRRVTDANYNFWLYDLCDVYLEFLKPVMQGEDEKLKENSRNVLCTCLDVGLRLISPMMPFVSEELWQRIPNVGNRPPSICVAEYPQIEQYPCRDASLDTTVDLVMSIVKSTRSLRADYELTFKVKTQLTIECADQSLSENINRFQLLIATLTNSSQVNVITSGNAQTPVGCAITTISDKVKIHLTLKGQIDVVKETEKLRSKREKIESQLKKLKEAAAKVDYEDKVPKEVRNNNAEKAVQYEGEIEHVISALQTLSSM